MFKNFISRKFPLDGIYNGHHQVTYRGVPAAKCPFDYVIYQMIVHEVKPDLILEIGTRNGGSALYLADLLSMTGQGKIHTVDLPANKENQALHTHGRISIFKEGYENYDIGQLENFRKIIVIEDGSHMYADSLRCLQLFSPFVSADSYYIAEDGIVNELGREAEFDGGPVRAIKEFLKTDSRFIIDDKWTSFFGKNATFNINGYLKRIR